MIQIVGTSMAAVLIAVAIGIIIGGWLCGHFRR